MSSLKCIKRMMLLQQHTDNNFPLQIEGMNVVTQNRNVKAFTLPQISWEPVFNLTPPQKAGDPPALFNYYPNDGGATRLFNNSVQFVPVAPIPVTNALVHSYHTDEKNKLAALFTLPFGLRAFATLDKTIQNPAPISKKTDQHLMINYMAVFN